MPPEIIETCEQGSEDWHKLRLASIGGSSISKITAKGGKQRTSELYSLAGELLTGLKADHFKFQHADRGHDFEGECRDFYSFTTGIETKQVALVRPEGVKYRHCSPDHLVGDDGMGEIKVRIPSVFVEAGTKGLYPITVRKQIQWSLWICEREWCDYIQYCPEMALQGINPLIVDRKYRDEEMIKELVEGADKFIEEMLVMVERMKKQ
jgi:hypothetical protein